MSIFDLTDTQAQYILDTPLRRLTRFDKLDLEREQETLRTEIAELTAILESDAKLRDLVSSELADIAKRFGTPRRTVLLESGGAALPTAVPLEVADDPCTVLLSATGLLARSAVQVQDPDPERTVVPAPRTQDGSRGGADSGRDDPAPRAAHDVIVSAVTATTRATIAVVTSAGRMIKLSVLELPALPPSANAPGLAGGAPASEFAALESGETVVALATLDDVGGGLALRGRRGQARAARLPASQGRVRGHRLEGRRPRGRRRAARERGRRPGLHLQRRPAAPLPRGFRASAGAVRGRHGRHQARRGRLGDLVRRRLHWV
jgi:DNA gyrase subunit A